MQDDLKFLYCVTENVQAAGEGSSKKQAEQNAAREALATEGCTDVGGN